MPKHDNRHGTNHGPQDGGPEDGTFNLAAGALGLGTAPDIFAGNLGNPPHASDSPPVQQIVFIEGDVPDAQLLAAGVAAGVRAVVLDPGSDGVAQIAAYLASHGLSGLTSIDIVSHGQDGQITLGTGTLSSATVAQYQAELSAIGAALAPGGDIQIYGCDVGQDAAGVAFLDQLSAAAGGANIAASSHLVGAALSGGNWTLDVNVGNVTVTDPFTAATEQSYAGVLATTGNQLFTVFNSLYNSANRSNERIEQIGVSGSILSGTSVDLADGSSNLSFVDLSGLAIDAPLKEYFVVNSDQSGGTSLDEIMVGTIGGGTPTIFFNKPDTYLNGVGPVFQLTDLALNQKAGQLYYGLESTDVSGNILATSGIYEISVAGGTPTQVVTGALVPVSLALDSTNNLVFFADSAPAVGDNNLDVGFLKSGTDSTAQVLNSQLNATLQGYLNGTDAAGLLGVLGGVAVNAATKTIYFTIYDSLGGASAADNLILSVTYNVSGTGVVTLGNTVNTLYAGAGADLPYAITIDPQNGVFYTQQESNQAIEVGSLTHTGAGNVTSLYNSTLNSGDIQNTIATNLVILSTPTIVASGTPSYTEGNAAIAIGGTPTLSNSDGQGLAGATVAIVNGTTSDVLAAITAGTSISASYNATTETLTLTGPDTLANYQTVLDSITFKTPGSDTVSLADTRTIDWTITDGVITSATAVSSVIVAARETIVAGATATFTGGGSPVVLDSTLTATDPSSTAFASATVVIGGFITGDTLTVGTPGGLTSSFSNGTLTLTGSASVATYQTALDSVQYGFSPANGDPTGGGSHTSRSISWTVNDGVVVSPTATSTLNVVHVPGTITTSGTVTYTGTPVALDTGVIVSDVDSGGNLTGATVTIGNFLSGDTLQFTTQNGITGTFSAGTLTLSGTSSLANYQTALDSVKYATTSATQSVRTISWTINDGASTSAASASAVNDVCFGVGTLIGTPNGEVQVEKLKVGDLVLTAHNGPRPITWIGKGKVLSTRGKRTAGTPVIVRKGALADNTPNQDLHVTRAHSLYLDGVLIPVEFLINHKTIIWDDRAQEIEIYHVELATHDVLIANGAPAETYRDDGNRWLFQNANEGWGSGPQEPYAPVVTGGPLVDAVWQRLLDRAGPRRVPPVTDDPDLHLLIDGVRVNPHERRGAMYAFRLTGQPASVRIVSRETVPTELGLARDPRSLGVALRRVVVAQGRHLSLIEAADELLADGFHGYEAAENLRWTTGDAELPVSALGLLGTGAVLEVHLGGATSYPLFGSLVAAA